MPDIHLTPEELRVYVYGQTDPARTLAVSDHLAGCGECRRALAGFDDGPDYEELAAAVNGTMDLPARAEFAARLAASPSAADELADLEQFKREVAARGVRDFGPPDAGAPPPTPAENVVRPSAAVWRTSIRTLAALAAVLALAAVAWWTLGRSAPGTATGSLLTDATGRLLDLATLPGGLRETVEQTIRTGQLEIAPLPPGVGTRRGVLAGAETPADFGLLAPVATLIRQPHPVLRWNACAGATGYVVTLTTTDHAGAWTSPELPADQTQWVPPAPLAPGVVYRWQVEARRGSETLARAPMPPAGEARFALLAEEPRAELAQIEARFGHFPLVMAVALARAGVAQEAAESLNVLAREHPRSSLAARLRQQTDNPNQSPSPINTNGAQ